MNENESVSKCPRCGSSRIVQGRLTPGDPGPGFDPVDIRLSVLKKFRHVPYVNDTESACIDCGLVWNEISPEDLTKLLSKYTSEADRKRLMAEHKPPPKDPFRR
jgi:DNA-directed RNA polymerase subunit RPC12/RpoP